MSRSVSFTDAVSVWWKIGILSFGGPAGQIALMHRIIVDEKKWLDEKRYLHALNYCMLLPGPEAMQLATYIGWLLHGVRGGLVAGLLFILPGAFAILALSWLYVLLGDLDAVQGLFLGLKAAVLAIVVQALIRIASRALSGVLKPLLAFAGFLALFVLGLPFPLVVLGAAVIGYLVSRVWPGANVGSAGDAASQTLVDPVIRPGTGRAALICLALWIFTVAALVLVLGADNVFSRIATFFSTMAVVTFGGAYAVLAYVAQQAVEQYQWLQPGEMLDGLGMAETTPGPLILVTQFVGFMGAMRQAGEPALLYGTLGALLTTWVTFLPCFLWIFAGAPHVERLRGNRALSAALAAITAAVVGVIANLALWFGLNLLFEQTRRIQAPGVDMLLPVLGSIDWLMVGMVCLAFVLVFLLRLGVLTVIGLTALSGIVLTLILSWNYS